MKLALILILTDILTLVALRQHFRERHLTLYRISVAIHLILSLFLWTIFFQNEFYDSFYDNPRHIRMQMNLRAMISALAFPRLILILLHFTGKLVMIRKGTHIRWLTTGGLIFSLVIFSAVAEGTFIGKYNFRTEYVEIKIRGLNKDLQGLRIVQLSDLHLASFYDQNRLLEELMLGINELKPDLILNTGDYVTYGWREFVRNDTILARAGSRYGNFSVLGNHDFGTYHPDFTQADRRNNVLIMNNLIRSSGYTVLNDTCTVINIGSAKIGIIGITTMGSHPHILHGNLGKAMAGLDNVDLKILLSHDPNQWQQDVAGKSDIDITLSGHTHGMQMGIYTKKFRWSPSIYFYPHWAGLFLEDNQFHYVNRGLGELAIPTRIWMPPEITVITLRTE